MCLCPSYVERVSDLLRQKLKQSDILLLKSGTLAEKRQEALEEQAKLEPRIDLLAARTKELQKLVRELGIICCDVVYHKMCLYLYKSANSILAKVPSIYTYFDEIGADVCQCARYSHCTKNIFFNCAVLICW